MRLRAKEQKGRIKPESSPCYCVPLIDFGFALVDYECRTVALASKRYLLSDRHFELLTVLLFAEGEVVSKAELVARLGMRGGRDSINRLVRQLRAMMLNRGQADAVEALGDGYRIKPPQQIKGSVSTRASDQAATRRASAPAGRRKVRARQAASIAADPHRQP